MAARKNYTAAQIINGLRRAEVGLANRKSMKEVIRDLGVSEQTYYRWRTHDGRRSNIGSGTATGGTSVVKIVDDRDIKSLKIVELG